MPKYEVEVREELYRIIEVEAEDSDEAEEIVYEMYNNEEIVLDARDCDGDVQIIVLGAVDEQ